MLTSSPVTALRLPIIFALAAIPLAGCHAAPPVSLPLAEGVVFFCPPKADAAIAELEKLHADGFNLVEFASWTWTIPTPGSDLERTASAVLDWCDGHDVRFFLMHNIQFGSPGEGGGLDDAVEDPLRAAKFLTDWVRVLKGHKCVAGIMLGNEVGPTGGNPKDHPKWWAAFIADLKARHKTIDALNAAWGTKFASFDAVAVPAVDSPGQVDYQRFAVEVFDRYYSALYSKVCEPALGKLLYCPKTGGDPLLHRACEGLSMICWDDVLADYPQWRIKAMGDIARTTGKPVFNSELHLYNDDYIYGGSPAKSRYRYFLSALNNEWMSASFAWGQWNKPAAKETHQATPGILADLRRLEPQLRKLSQAPARLHVLLTDRLNADDDASQALYTQVACLGLPWAYLCPQDIHRLREGMLYIPAHTRLPRVNWQAIMSLPKGVAVYLDDRCLLQDEYGRKPDPDITIGVTRRASLVHDVRVIPLPADSRLRAPYSQAGEAAYLNWSPERGHFHYPVAYPQLEARRVRDGSGWLVAVINHATGGEPVKARLPWADGARSVRELTGGAAQQVDLTAEATFAPLDVRLYRYE
jgi:hypothetical protein